MALTRDYDNNIQQHKFPHLPAPGVCCIKFWTCLIDTSITVSSSAERGIMCDKILGPDTLNVDMGDFVWNNTASCKCRIWNEVQLISVCCPSLHFWLVPNKIFWSWNWRAPIWWAVWVGCIILASGTNNILPQQHLTGPPRRILCAGVMYVYIAIIYSWVIKCISKKIFCIFNDISVVQ